MSSKPISLQDAASFLFVPGDRPERFAKAAASGAHQIIIDLEDAVAPAAKATAREAARAWFADCGSGVVRINDARADWHAEDLAMCRLPTVTAVMLPKAEDAVTVAAVHAATGKPVIALIESAAGLSAVKAVAAATGVARLAFGSIDLCLDLGLDVSDEQLDGFRLELTLASRLAGLPAPIDGVIADFRAAEALGQTVQRVRGLGFGAKLAIHPLQVEPINAGFAPQADQIAWAQRVVAAGEGASAIDGEMIDKPVRERALRILDRAGLGAA